MKIRARRNARVATLIAGSAFLIPIAAPSASAQERKSMQPRKAMKVGKVDRKKYAPARDAAVALEQTWTNAATPDDLKAPVSRLSDQISQLNEPERTEADRLFVRALRQSVSTFASGISIWEARDDESRRAAAEAVSNNFAVEAIPWSSRERSTIVLEEAAGLLRAADHFYLGRIGDGLATEQELFDRLAARRAQRTKTDGSDPGPKR